MSGRILPMFISGKIFKNKNFPAMKTDSYNNVKLYMVVNPNSPFHTNIWMSHTVKQTTGCSIAECK